MPLAFVALAEVHFIAASPSARPPLALGIAALAAIPQPIQKRALVNLVTRLALEIGRAAAVHVLAVLERRGALHLRAQKGSGVPVSDDAPVKQVLGQGLPEHSVPGSITVLCLEGEAIVTTSSRRCALGAGRLVVLKGGEPHSVQAVTDASLLVTVLLHTSSTLNENKP